MAQGDECWRGSRPLSGGFSFGTDAGRQGSIAARNRLLWQLRRRKGCGAGSFHRGSHDEKNSRHIEESRVGGSKVRSLQPSNRRWLFPFIKRKNFRFLESVVFNDIGDFRGKMARFRGCPAGHGPGSPWLNGGQGTPGTGKKCREGGSKSREPSASNRLWAPALSLTRIFCSHARASAHAREASDWPRDCWLRERCSQPKLSRSCPPKWGWGFSPRHRAKRPTTMGSHAENFFRPFDFGHYSSMTYRGKSNAHAGW